MLLCKGKQCIWRKVCSRYVIGQAARNLPKNDGDTIIDHCLRHQDKFVRKQEQDDACISHAEREQTRDKYPKFIAINSEEGRQVAEKLNHGLNGLHEL